jgi:DNA-binding NarL/FixJ family response regulator
LSDSRHTSPVKARGERIRVLLVDDHALVRRGFRRLLEDDRGLEVVGEANDGRQAVELARSLLPDVVVMDCAMPGTSGLVATREIVRGCPAARVLMLSMHAEDTLVHQAFEAGAQGYVLKNALDFDLASAVRRIAGGERVLDPGVSSSPPLKGERSRLTARELEVLQLICEGKSNREIAAALELSPNTVAVHRANIMNALGVHKAAELVAHAIQRGLVSMP